MGIDVEYVYEAVRLECAGLDSIYEDCIIDLVGRTGLKALLHYKLLETCGVINGRQLYVLLDK